MPETLDLPVIGTTKTTYVYIAGAVVAGIVGYAYYARAKSSAADAAVTDPVYAAAPVDAGGTTTAGISTPSTPTANESPDPDTLPPTTNIAWSQRVTHILTETFGYDGQMVAATIGKYLARQGLVADEANLIRTAWGQLGRPPEGDFPILTVPSPPTPAVPVVPPPAAPTMTPAYSLSVGAGSKVAAFTDTIRARSGKDVDWGLLERTNTGLAGNVRWVADINSRTFKSAATYQIPSVPK